MAIRDGIVRCPILLEVSSDWEWEIDDDGRLQITVGALGADALALLAGAAKAQIQAAQAIERFAGTVARLAARTGAGSAVGELRPAERAMTADRINLAELRAFRAPLTPETVLALLDAVEAARPFADDQTCLDAHCTHLVCVLNKALARFDFGGADA